MTNPRTNIALQRSTPTQLVEASQPATPATMVYPAQEYPPGSGDRILAGLMRQRFLFGGVVVAVAVAGTLFTMQQAPRYSATALLLIDPSPEQVVPDRGSVSARLDAGLIESEIESIRSPVLVNRLADALDLDRDPEWAPKGTASAGPKTFNAPPVDAFPAHYIPGDTAASSALVPASPVRTVPQETTAAVAEALSVRRRGLSYVVEVSALSESPSRAAEMANGLSSIYLASLDEARQAVSQEANSWLDTRLAELRQEVQDKTAAAQTYRAERNLLTAQGVSLAEQQMVEVQSGLLATRAAYAQQRAQYELVSDLARAGESLNSLDIPDDAIRDLRSKEATLAQRIADLSARYGDAHPTLRQAREEKAALDQRISNEMGRLAASAKVKADALGARLGTQQAQLNGLRGKLVSDSFDEVRLSALQADAEAARVVYESFLQRSHEIANQGAPTGVSARLLAPAEPPASPASPHLLLNAALSILAGVILGLIAALLADRARRTIETCEEAEEKLGVRALVGVPDLAHRDLRHMPERNRSPMGYMLAKRLSQFTESFRVLQTAIMLTGTSFRNTVAITSAMPGDGKTTLSLGLARVAGMGGLKVIVVDCDIRMRTINKLLDIEPETGLQQVLSGEKDWRDVVACDPDTGIHVLPASSLATKDVFSTGALETLVAELSQHYQLVVLDCAPVFAVADTRMVASLADTVVVAARAGKTPTRAVRAAIAQLELAGANVLGLVLNRVDVRKAHKRSFYDGLYYSKAFSGYYTREA